METDIAGKTIYSVIQSDRGTFLTFFESSQLRPSDTLVASSMHRQPGQNSQRDGRSLFFSDAPRQMLCGLK